MKALVYFAVMLSVSFSANLQASVKGQCLYEGKPLVFIDAHAALAPDPFEVTKQVPMLWFTTSTLDHAALLSAKADDIDDAVSDQVFQHDGAKLELRLDLEGTLIEGLQLYVPPGNNRSLSGNEVGNLQLSMPMKNRAAGQFILEDDSELKCDLQFDIPMAGKGSPASVAKPWGAALPADGGEPARIYLNLRRATMAGDADAMMSLVTKEKADKMREARSDPEFPKMLEMIKAFEPAEVRIVSGRADANRAELQIAGKEADGALMTGVVKLVREAGNWRVENISTKSKM